MTTSGCCARCVPMIDRPGLVPMRVGVNTGKVFAGDFGPSYRRTYSVFGDAINTAARVMAKAEAGQILSTEIVLSRSRTISRRRRSRPSRPRAKRSRSWPRSSVRRRAGARHSAMASPCSGGTRSSGLCSRASKGRGRATARSSRSPVPPAWGKAASSTSSSPGPPTSDPSRRAARTTRSRRRTSHSGPSSGRPWMWIRARRPTSWSSDFGRRSNRWTPDLAPWVPAPRHPPRHGPRGDPGDRRTR